MNQASHLKAIVNSINAFAANVGEVDLSTIEANQELMKTSLASIDTKSSELTTISGDTTNIDSNITNIEACVDNSKNNIYISTKTSVINGNCPVGVGLARQDNIVSDGKNVFITTGPGTIEDVPQYINPGGNQNIAYACPRMCIADDDLNLASINTGVTALATTVNMSGFQTVDIATINGSVPSFNAGTLDGGTQRIAIATDDVNLASIKTNIQNLWTRNNDNSSGYVPAFNVNLRGIHYGATDSAIDVTSGDKSTGTIRVCIADNDTNLLAIKTDLDSIYTAVQVPGDILTDVWDSSTHNLHQNLRLLNGQTIEVNSGNKNSGTQRICIASDDINIATLNTNIANLNTILTDVYNVVTHTLKVTVVP